MAAKKKKKNPQGEVYNARYVTTFKVPMHRKDTHELIFINLALAATPSEVMFLRQVNALNADHLTKLSAEFHLFRKGFELSA